MGLKFSQGNKPGDKFMTMFNLTETRKNLEAAFAGESMANRKYLYFARLARELGDEEVAKVFEETAEQETHHALSHLRQLYPKESLTVEKLLEMAIAGERYEHTVMYPDFEAVAVKENQPAAIEEFRQQAQESQEHEAMFKATLENARKRFEGLKQVEKMHADHYQRLLDQRRG
jgi:rubrerythrin